MLFILPVAVFIITFASAYLLGLRYLFGSNAVATRLSEMLPSEQVTTPATQTAGNADSMPTITKLISGKSIAAKLYTELSAAGLPIRPSEFVGICALSVIISQILSVLFTRGILGNIIFAIIGISIPILVLKYKQSKRRTAFNAQIPDTLTMISSSLRSGFSLLRAMQIIIQEMPSPVSAEFDRIVSEVNVGKPIEDALKSCVDRMKSYDFDLAATAIIIQLHVGGNLSEILETIAHTIRERVRLIGELRALTAEGRLSGIILFFLPVFIGAFIAVKNPNYMSVLIAEPFGHILIGLTIVLQTIGGIVIHKMLAVDV